jgi:asparagine synthase (glutamine-hydrolysing)
MNEFAGLVTFDGALPDPQTADQLGRAITAQRKGRASARRSDGALFVQRVAVAAGPRHGEQPVSGSDGRDLFVALSRLDNREELGAALSIAPTELAHLSDGLLVLRMFERWGEAGLARCLGAFAFALWNAEARRLILGRDCLGQRALFFHRGRDFVAFATTLGALLALPRVPRDLDERVLANYLAINLHEAHRTFYRGIARVPSRTIVMIDQTSVRHRRYWSPDLDAPPPYLRDEDYVERARELLDRAVAAATCDTPRVAVSASGGFDSSAVAATAARLGRAERITCYVLTPPADLHIDVGPGKYLDERDKVEALARMHPSLDVRFIAPERPHPFEEDSIRYFARTNLPALNPSNLGWFSHLYDAAAVAGHRALLTGTRGNFGLTWHGRFSLLALLHDGQWAEFASELPAVARQSGRSLSRAIASEVLVPGGPAWLRRLLYRLSKGDPDSVAFYSALNPAYVAECDLARQWRAQGFQEPWFRTTGWNGARVRARLLLDFNQFGRDAAAMNFEHHGFELRDPHSDRRLLEFSLCVPEWMYRRNGVPRSFARRVLADRLPREILEEHRRGAQGGAWFRRLDMRRRDVATEIERLEGSPLASRLIDVPRLKRLMSEWPKDEHAAELRKRDFYFALDRGLQVGRFIRWAEGGNA